MRVASRGNRVLAGTGADCRPGRVREGSRTRGWRAREGSSTREHTTNLRERGCEHSRVQATSHAYHSLARVTLPVICTV